MGWDAYATGKLTPEAKKAFAEASDAAVAVTGSVDVFLSTGGLDCSACARAIDEYTSMSPYLDYTPAEVAKAYLYATWPEYPVGSEHMWAVESAKQFLRVLSEHGLGFEASI